MALLPLDLLSGKLLDLGISPGQLIPITVSVPATLSVGFFITPYVESVKRFKLSDSNPTNLSSLESIEIVEILRIELFELNKFALLGIGVCFSIAEWNASVS